MGSLFFKENVARKIVLHLFWLVEHFVAANQGTQDK